MKAVSFPLALVTLLFFLGSCSVSRKIDSIAKESALQTPGFKPAHAGIAIYDVEAGKYIYRYQADKYFVPASNTKIITCYAALRFLKDSVPALNYEILNDSVIRIQPLGDPTFLHADYPFQPVYQLLKKYKTIQVIDPAFNAYLGNGWSWDDYLYAYMAQRSPMPIYGNVASVDLTEGQVSIIPRYFRGNMTTADSLQAGFSLSKAWDSNTFQVTSGSRKSVQIPFVPNPGTLKGLLADTLQAQVEIVNGSGGNMQTFKSVHLDSVLKPMMHRSDNFFAEQMLLSAGRTLTGNFNESEIVDTLSALLFPGLPQPPNWVDGSGLSRFNLFSPQDLVTILSRMKDEFGMERLQHILPTGGTGTLSSYYKGDEHYIYAKTGTLNGVVALSGFLYTKKNRLLIFSVLVNNHHTSATEIRKGIEKFLTSVRTADL